jgi:hypothetical protein
MSQNSLVLPTTGTVSGLTMTQDINSALDTLNTCASGGSAPSSPEDCQLWADTTNNLLKQWDATNSVWQIVGVLRASSANFVHGACRLVWSSATALILNQFNGNGLIINGIPCIIPSAGVTLSNSGLSASTLYYVYASLSAGSIVLSASATAPALGTNGVYQMSGNAAYTLVGMAYTNSSAQFVDDPVNGRLVRSWFNRVRTQMSQNVANSTASATDVVLSNTLQFLAWGDEQLTVGVAGFTTINAAANIASTIYLDGSAVGETCITGAYTASADMAVSCGYSTVPAIGLHSFNLRGHTGSSANGTWSATLNALIG